MSDRHICQVAFCALDAARLRDWYADVFGLVKSGKMLFFPPATSTVQGIPGAWEKCSWLIDQQDYFQLEFFEFLKPHSRLKPDSWRISDIGYNMLGIAVNNFDQVIRNLCAISAMDDAPVTGTPGQRRCSVTDCEGNWVEIFEQDPLLNIAGASAVVLRPELPAVVRSMRVVVPDLATATKTYVEALGLQPVNDFELHSSADEAQWQLDSSQCERLLLRSANFLLELIEYKTSQLASWPDGYTIADQGFMNIAMGYRTPQALDTAFSQATANGMTPNGKIVDAGLFRVMYVNDPQGFSVEMLYARKPLWSLSGFNPRAAYVEIGVEINAPANTVWRQLTEPANFANWSPFKARIVRAAADSGVGQVRELKAPGQRLLEEVIEWDTDRHYAYELRSGAPIRNHRGDVTLTTTGDTTQVRWSIRFDGWIPFSNPLIAWYLRWLFGRGLRKLKQQLETQR